jgi:hypothetical protein
VAGHPISFRKLTFSPHNPTARTIPRGKMASVWKYSVVEDRSADDLATMKGSPVKFVGQRGRSGKRFM